jgi:hypothetical protein
MPSVSTVLVLALGRFVETFVAAVGPAWAHTCGAIANPNSSSRTLAFIQKIETPTRALSSVTAKATAILILVVA